MYWCEINVYRVFFFNVLFSQSFSGSGDGILPWLKHTCIVFLWPARRTWAKGLKLGVSPGYRQVWDPENTQSGTHRWQLRLCVCHRLWTSLMLRGPNPEQQGPKTTLPCLYHRPLLALDTQLI